MKKILLILMLASPVFAGGPKYSWQDPKLNDEWGNNYKEHSFPNIINGRASTMTVTYLNVSSITATKANIATLVASSGTINSFMVVGTATNDNAPSGRTGEYIESVVGSIAAGATTVYKDLTSISLTAGDWDVTGITIWDVPQAATTDIECIVSVTSGNSVTGATVGSNWTYYSTASGNLPAQGAFSISSYRLSLNTTTTVYLKVRVDRSSGSPVFDGSRLSARRIR